jgi:hypothetical protein
MDITIAVKFVDNTRGGAKPPGAKPHVPTIDF